MDDKEDLTGLTDDERRRLGRSPDPVLPGQVTTRVTPPGPVQVSFWFWLAGGLVLIGGQVLTLVLKQQLIDQLIKQNREAGRQFDAASIASGTTTLVWVLFVGAVVFALLMALFAYRPGKAPARRARCSRGSPSRACCSSSPCSATCRRSSRRCCSSSRWS